jgi:integrase
MAVRKTETSWLYDFKLSGHPRQRKGGFRTKAEAEAAEKRARMDVITGAKKFTFAESYRMYMDATDMSDTTREHYEHQWKRIEPLLGHLFVEQVDTVALDAFKQKLPKKFGPATVNHHLGLIRATLRFMWKRQRLQYVPYIPMMTVPRKHYDWYTQAERDRLLDGMFRMRPHWYLFFYLTCRLGLRTGEVYAISRRQIRDVPPQLVIDQSVQRGTDKRPPQLVERKNDEAYVLDLTPDVVDAIKWHIQQGYAGPEFLFSKDGTWPRYRDSHVRPLREVQRALGLRELTHHYVGRHSVASQAATGGESIKAIQAQLGHRSEQSTHRYAHLGNGAQLRLVKALAPAAPPHGSVVSSK